MAFQAPNVGQGVLINSKELAQQVRANRKIIEELEEQKKRLRIQNQTPGPIPSAVSTTPVLVSQPPPLPSDVHPMTSAQRSALQHAHANSVGYFITQDSSYGNLILPVLPRFEK